MVSYVSPTHPVMVLFVSSNIPMSEYGSTTLQSTASGQVGSTNAAVTTVSNAILKESLPPPLIELHEEPVPISRETNSIRTHRKSQDWNCKICQKFFNKKSDWKAHMSSHKNAYPYRFDSNGCFKAKQPHGNSKCFKKTKDNQGLKRKRGRPPKHRVTKPIASTTVHKCTWLKCPEELPSEEAYTEHMKEHRDKQFGQLDKQCGQQLSVHKCRWLKCTTELPSEALLEAHIEKHREAFNSFESKK